MEKKWNKVNRKEMEAGCPKYTVFYNLVLDP